MDLSENEASALAGAAALLDGLRQHLERQPTPGLGTDASEWFSILTGIKPILGNFSNHVSLVACLMAKEYLVSRFSMVPYDAAAKPQGAGGLDIDERTTSGDRVIGEIKTTTPLKNTMFGANQRKSLLLDFAKLRKHDAVHKFMFVTSIETYNAILAGQVRLPNGVTIVCLTTGDEHHMPDPGPHAPFD